jgi:hypothetical protein
MLELFQGRNNGGRVVWPSNPRRKRHDVLGLLLLRFGLQVTGPNLDAGGIFGEERQDVDMGVLEQLIVGVLGKSLAEVGFILAKWLQHFHHRRVWVLADMLHQAGQGHGEGWGYGGRHLDDGW